MVLGGGTGQQFIVHKITDMKKRDYFPFTLYILVDNCDILLRKEKKLYLFNILIKIGIFRKHMFPHKERLFLV